MPNAMNEGFGVSPKKMAKLLGVTEAELKKAMKQAQKGSTKPAKMPGKPKKMNALDAAIMKQKPLKSKNKKPGRFLDK